MNRPTLQHPLAPFALATLTPVPFLLLGGFIGATWTLPALLWLTVVLIAADRFLTDTADLIRWLPRRKTKPAPAATEAAAHAPDPAEPPVEEADTAFPVAVSDPASKDDRAWDDIDSTIASLLRDDPAEQRHAAFSPIAPDAPQGPADAAPAGKAPGTFRTRAADLVTALSARLGAIRSSSGRPLRDSDRLSLVLAASHLLLMIAAIYGLSGRAGYGVFGWTLAFLAFGLWFGQVSNANAHALIHRRDRRLRALGAAIYATMGFGHHASAHRLVHHRFVATLDDPNTAQLGESIYGFIPRAWSGAFVAGYEMEAAILRRRPRRRMPPLHPYVWYLAGTILTALLILILFGITGLLAWVLLAGFAQLQILLADYVQHYGLRRRALSLGKVEALGLRHSWDAPQPFSAALTLNLPRHADHHLNPNRCWSELDSRAVAPRLPHSLPVMAAVALWPGKWRGLMDKRAKAAMRAT